MKKGVLLSSFTSLALVCALSTNCLAYAKAEPSKMVKYTPENVQKYEKRPLDSKIKIESKFVLPTYVDPGSESVQVVTCAPWSTNYTYDDSSKSGILGNIANVVLTVSGYAITKTVINVVKDILVYMLGMASNSYNSSQGASVRLFHSYSYIDKLGQYYNSSYGWITKVHIQERLLYVHEFGSFAGSDGRTHTETYDNGRPSATEPKQYFNDNNWIVQETQNIKHSYTNYVNYYADAGISYGY